MLSDRVELSSAKARVEGIVGGAVGLFELIQKDRARTHTEPKLAVLRLTLFFFGYPELLELLELY